MDIPDLTYLISIHAPRGGSDFILWSMSSFNNQFQSTLPVGGATSSAYPAKGDSCISIHAPRGGSDALLSPSSAHRWLFQSTLPVGGATAKMLERGGHFRKKLGLIWCISPKSLFFRNLTPKKAWKKWLFSVRTWRGILFASPSPAIPSRYPPGDRCSGLRSVLLCFHSDCPDSKSAGYPFLCP